MSRSAGLDEGVVVNVRSIRQFRPLAGRRGYRLLAAVVALGIGAAVTLAAAGSTAVGTGSRPAAAIARMASDTRPGMQAGRRLS
jgi:hypothetical protein